MELNHEMARKDPSITEYNSYQNIINLFAVAQDYSCVSIVIILSVNMVHRLDRAGMDFQPHNHLESILVIMMKFNQLVYRLILVLGPSD